MPHKAAFLDQMEQGKAPANPDDPTELTETGQVELKDPAAAFTHDTEIHRVTSPTPETAIFPAFIFGLDLTFDTLGALAYLIRSQSTEPPAAAHNELFGRELLSWEEMVMAFRKAGLLVVLPDRVIVGVPGDDASFAEMKKILREEGL